MLGLTQLGIIHTLISLAGLACGLVALSSTGMVRLHTRLGLAYVIGTVLSCLTGFGIFQHGGFGKPHVLGIVTLLVLAVAVCAARGAFGRMSRYVEVVSLSLTVFFHFIPGLTETGTRLPVGNPVFANAEAPELKGIVGVLFLVFLAGAVLQVRYLRREPGAGAGSFPGRIA
ncbi:DUF2306 domain-containing protein [Cupriavidus necator]|uniref:DUF2306 domain-containing protein n=1 Tax=Cupriavidus necator (strain ATCC 17699 / DSM 428 / KCTC 22496 / NCIMB 10442 / H16 / Stanier 337) TaxID=381666 RepID=Q0JYA5_CUPNH|nr:hypothetical protein [Cupriavidus necator]QCC05031.1 hypothetical protein E6A55_31725 [Cupriavidus necator H16]QQB79719.1 hypothetical protein I6H87_31275 [Cupriavidus necator]WKA43964.1 hypothetical protein QWP09_31755 [Cupriavidus necator]CAJ97269.1 conserved hypothetical protein [Cupriavidus necator H16]